MDPTVEQDVQLEQENVAHILAEIPNERPGTDAPVSLDPTSIDAVKWNYRNRAERYENVATVAWNVAAQTKSIVVTIPIRSAAIAGRTYILGNYKYYRFRSISIIVESNVNEFACGHMKFVYMPPNSVRDTAVIAERCLTKNGAHYLASENTQVMMDIPFSYDRDWAINDERTDLGYFYGVVVSPLRFPETETMAVNLVVMAKINDLELYFPTPPKPLTQGATEDIKYFPSTHKFQGNFDTVRLGPGHVGGMGTGIAEQGICTNLSYLLSQECIFGAFKWSTTNPQGTVLVSIPVRPMSLFDPVDNAFSQDPPRDLLSFLGYFLQYWSGSIVHRFIASKSAFHTGKLAMVLAPPGESVNAGNYTNYPYIVYDLKKQSIFSFRCGANADTGLRLSGPHWKGATTVNLHNFYSTAVVHVVVHTPLKKNTSMVDAIDITVWRHGHEGKKGTTRFFLPAYFNSYIRSPVTQGMTVATTSSMEEPDILGDDVDYEPVGQFGVEEIMDLRQLTSRAHPMVLQPDGRQGNSPYEWYPVPVYPTITWKPVTGSTLPYFEKLFAWWGGSLNYMVQSAANTLQVQVIPFSFTDPSDINNREFEYYPGGVCPLMNIQNTESFVTFNVPDNPIKKCNRVYSNDYSTNPWVFNVFGGDAIFYNQQLKFRSFDSNTGAFTDKLLVYVSTGSDFWYSGYVGYSPLQWRRTASNMHVLKRSRSDYAILWPVRNVPVSNNRDGGDETDDVQEEMMLVRGLERALNATYEPINATSTSNVTSIGGLRLPVEYPDYSQDSGVHVRRRSIDEEVVWPDEENSGVTGRQQGEEVSWPNDESEGIVAVQQAFRSSFAHFPPPPPQPSTSQAAPPTYTARHITRLVAEAMGTGESSENTTDDTTDDGFLGNISNSARNVANSSKKFGRLLDSIDNSKVSKTLEYSEKTSKNIHEFTEKLCNDGVLSVLGLSGDHISVGTILIVEIMETLLINNSIKWGGFLMKISSVLGVSDKLLRKVCEVVGLNRPNEFAEDMPRQQAMSGDMVASMVTLAVMAIGFKATGADKVDPKQCKSVWDFVATRCRDMSWMKNGITAFLGAFGEIRELVHDALLKFGFLTATPGSNIGVDKDFIVRLEQYAQGISHFSDLEVMKKLVYDPLEREAFKEFYTLHNTMLADSIRKKINRDLLFRFTQGRTAFEKMCSAVVDNAATCSIRCDPFQITVSGLPGIGKGIVTHTLANLLCDVQKVPEFGRIYTRTTGMDFYDNYAGQFCFIEDDKDQIQDATEAQAFIQQKSNIPLILNMADLKKKGAYFMSKLMIASTNCPYPEPPQIVEVDAYLRRRDVLIKAERKYENGVPVPYASDMSHLTFKRLNPLSREGQVLNEFQTFPELLGWCSQAFSSHLDAQYKLVASCERNFEPPVVYFLGNTLNESILKANIMLENYIAIGQERAGRVRREVINIPGFDPVDLPGVPVQQMERAEHLNIPMNPLAQEAQERSEEFLRNTRVPLEDDPQFTHAGIEEQHGRLVCYGITRKGNKVRIPTSRPLVLVCLELIREEIHNMRNDPEMERYGVIDWNASEANIARELGAIREFQRRIARHRVDNLQQERMTAEEAQYINDMFADVEGAERIIFLGKEAMNKLVDMAKAELDHVSASWNRFKDNVSNIIGIYSYIPNILRLYFNIRGRGVYVPWFVAPEWYRVYSEYIHGNEYNPGEDSFQKAYDSAFDNDTVFNDYMRDFNRRNQRWIAPWLSTACERFRFIVEVVIAVHVTPAAWAARTLGVCAKMTLEMGKMVWTLIKDHMWISIACGIGIAIYIVYRYFHKDAEVKNKSIKVIEGESMMPIQDHKHLDVPDDGEAHDHVHLCDRCSKPFVHSHKKNPPDVSIKFMNLCYSCRTKEKHKLTVARNSGKPVAMILYEEDLESGEDVNPGEVVVHPNPVVDVEHLGEEEEEPVVGIQEAYSRDKGRRPAKVRAVVEGDVKKKAHVVLTPEDDAETARRQAVKVVVEGRHRHPTHTEDDLGEEVVLPKVKAGVNSVAQGAVDPNALDLSQKIQSNSGRIIVGACRLCYFGVFGKVILVPAHLFTLVGGEGVSVSLSRFGQWYSFVLNPNKHIYKWPDIEVAGRMYPRDMILVDTSVCPQIPAFVDLRKHFVHAHDVAMANRNPALLVGWRTAEAPLVYHISTVKCRAASTFLGLVPTATWKTWEYNVPTCAGMCGSILITCNPKMQQKIIGMHVGGIEKLDIGYAQLVYKEIIVKGCEKSEFPFSINAPTQQSLSDHIVFESSGKGVVPQGPNFVVMGEVKQRSLVSPLKSDIKPSPLFDEIFKHTTEPAVLMSDDPRNTSGEPPLQKALNKYGASKGGWDPQIRQIVVEDQFWECQRILKHWPGEIRVLTQDEAINGIPGLIEPMKMDTSPGFPFVYSRKPGECGRKFLFDVEELPDKSCRYTPKAELQEEIDNILKHAKEDHFCYHNYYMDWLKDERRPLAKVADGNTRIFNVANVAWLIVNKMYFGAFCAATVWANVDMGIALGVDMHGADVTRMVNMMSHRNHFDGDVKKWDGTFDSEIIDMCIEVVVKWLCTNDESVDYKTCKTIMSSLFWRIHICGLVVYMLNCGMGSGTFITGLFNSLGHRMRVKMTWLVLARRFEPEIATMRHFYLYVLLLVCGDDLWICVDDHVKEWFNPTLFTIELKRYGIQYVPPSKISGATIEGFVPLAEISFLKCKFREDSRYPGKWHAAISIDNTIQELINWIRNGHPDEELLASNIEDALRFAYGHGEEFFEDFKRRITNACAKKGLDVPYLSYNECDIAWRKSHDLI